MTGQQLHRDDWAEKGRRRGAEGAQKGRRRGGEGAEKGREGAQKGRKGSSSQNAHNFMKLHEIYGPNQEFAIFFFLLISKELIADPPCSARQPPNEENDGRGIGAQTAKQN